MLPECHSEYGRLVHVLLGAFYLMTEPILCNYGRGQAMFLLFLVSTLSPWTRIISRCKSSSLNASYRTVISNMPLRRIHSACFNELLCEDQYLQPAYHACFENGGMICGLQVLMLLDCYACRRCKKNKSVYTKNSSSMDAHRYGARALQCHGSLRLRTRWLHWSPQSCRNERRSIPCVLRSERDALKNTQPPQLAFSDVFTKPTITGCS